MEGCEVVDTKRVIRVGFRYSLAIIALATAVAGASAIASPFMSILAKL